LTEYSWQEAFVMTFVPLFIVIDALGNLPFIISLSEDMTTRERRKMVHIAILTATVVGLAFLFFGQFILNVLDIKVGAFAIGSNGGVDKRRNGGGGTYRHTSNRRSGHDNDAIAAGYPIPVIHGPDCFYR